MQPIDIKPNPSKLLESLRSLTYTNASAIADLVDNSLDAGATEIQISLPTREGVDEIWILDDGCGMDFETLKEAIKLGSDTEKDATCLGKFGMGLVTASISMGRRLEVVSKIAGAEPRKVCLDLDNIGKDWVATEEELSESDDALMQFVDSGTLVRITKLDNVAKNIGTTVSGALRRIFRGFISLGCTISVNNETLEAWDPLERDKAETEILFNEDIDVAGEKVHVTVAFLDPKASRVQGRGKYKDGTMAYNQDNQGYYVVRNNRELAEGQSLGLYVKHPSFDRFRCEVNYPSSLDKEFGINFTKHNLRLAQSVADKIDSVTRPFRNMIASDARHKEAVSGAERLDHTDAEKVIERKKALLKGVKAVVEKRSKRIKHNEPVVNPPKPNPDPIHREPRVVHSKNKAPVASFEEADLGSNGPLFDSYFETNKIVVRWNIRHPFYAQVVAPYADDKNVVTPIDLLIYSFAQAELTLENGSEVQQLFQLSMSTMSDSLRILLQ